MRRIFGHKYFYRRQQLSGSADGPHYYVTQLLISAFTYFVYFIYSPSSVSVSLQLQNSTDIAVVLRSVSLQSTGRYRCEVSGEAPSFQTVSGHEDMIVVGK